MADTPEIEEYMQGGALLLRGVGRARKLVSRGWLVIAEKGKPFTYRPDVVARALAGRPTDRVQVKTKAEARKVLRDLAKQQQSDN